MAEGGGLLNRYTVNIRIVGSNPIPSAILGFVRVVLPARFGNRRQTAGAVANKIGDQRGAGFLLGIVLGIV